VCEVRNVVGKGFAAQDVPQCKTAKNESGCGTGQRVCSRRALQWEIAKNGRGCGVGQPSWAI